MRIARGLHLPSNTQPGRPKIGRVPFLDRFHGCRVEPVGGRFGWSGEALKKLPRDANRAAHLRALARLADEYFDQPRESEDDLRATLKEFRESCDRLLVYDHPQLDQPTRDWLFAKCRVWAESLDERLAGLAADGSSRVRQRRAADQFLEGLSNALNQEAARPTVGV